MSGLAVGLLGIAALLGGRGFRVASVARVRERAGSVASSRSGRIHGGAVLHRHLWAVAASVAGWLLAGWVGVVIGVGAGLGAERLGQGRARARSSAERDEQLADAVGAIGSAMRAGLSLTQAIAYAAAETDEPLRTDLAALVRDVEVGEKLEAAVEAFAVRIGSEDVRLVTAALGLHRRTGSDLPIVLDQIGATIRERLAVAREVRALTAQARLSGLILGCLPIAFFGFMWLISRRDIEAALSTPAGVAAVGLGLVLELIAFLWIRHLLEIG